MSEREPEERPFGARLREALPEPPGGPELRRRVRQRLDAELAAAGRRRPRALVAAALLAPAIVVGILLLRSEPRHPTGTPAGSGADRQLELVSGARIVVRAGSELSVERDEPLAGRLRLDHGVVVVEAEKRPGRTFAVVAGDLQVTVVGTLFAVERSEGREATVRVASGTVRVTRGSETWSVGPGEIWPAGAAGAQITADDLARLRAPALNGSPGPTVTAPASEAPAATPPPAFAPERPGSPAMTSRDPDRLPYRRAQRLERDGDLEGATAAYTAIVEGSGRYEEDALFAVGRLHVRRGETAPALETFLRYRQRHPAGAYARAVDVHVLDLLLAKGDKARVLEEADRFLAAHPDDPRADRFRLARAALDAERGACARALADVAALPDGDVPAAVRRRCVR